MAHAYAKRRIPSPDYLAHEKDTLYRPEMKDALESDASSISEKLLQNATVSVRGFSGVRHWYHLYSVGGGRLLLFVSRELDNCLSITHIKGDILTAQPGCESGLGDIGHEEMR